MRRIARALVVGGVVAGNLFFGLRESTAAESWQLEELQVVLEKLRAENADLKSQLELRETVIRNLQESLAVARTESELFQRKWMEAQARAETLGANPADTEAAATQRQLLETVRQLALAEADRRRLTEQLQRLLVAVQSNANLGAELEATRRLLADLQQPSAPAVVPSGRLEAARILDVNAKLRVVVLDVGAEQGARIGMPFWVFRGERVVARLRVVEVRPKVCGALLEDVEKGVTLQAGDMARVTQTVSGTRK